MTDRTAAPGPSPWARWGWAMGAVWLVFLGFTIVAVATADRPLWQRGVALASLALFVTVYLHGFMRMTFEAVAHRTEPGAWSHLLMLAVLAVPPCVVAGGSGLGTLPFVAAYVMFSLRIAWVFPIVATAIALPVALPALGVVRPGQEPQALIVLLVAATTGMVRVINQRDDRHRVTAREYEIVAERERVARDVHDVLGHSLAVLAIKAELAERVLDDDPERTRSELRQIQSLTRESIGEIRATVAGLRVARLGDELEAARTALTAAGIESEIPDRTDAVDPRHRLVLAWVLREAVTNVVRHSAARRCTVRLASSGLTVEDDGRGLAGATDGNGLRGIRERVSAVGGELSVGPGDGGRGTRLEAML